MTQFLFPLCDSDRTPRMSLIGDAENTGEGGVSGHRLAGTRHEDIKKKNVVGAEVAAPGFLCRVGDH